MKDCFIVDGIRTPIGKLGGSLASIRTDDLAALALNALMQRNSNIDSEFIDDVILGCANQAGEDNRNVARMALLLAGISWKVPGETVNRLCASGLAAVISGYRAISMDQGDLIIAGGVESMTRAPYVISKSSAPFGRDAELADSSFGWRFINPKMKALYGTDSMGETAENLASRYKLSREVQDAFAFASQQKAFQSQNSGRFDKEIQPVELKLKNELSTIFSKDEFLKPSTSLEGLAKLKPAFKKTEEGGSVTPGNASGLNDGAAALLLASESAIKKHSLKPMARILAAAVCGVEPNIMGIGPVPASLLALKRANLTLENMDIIELNEAFAAQVLACLQEWKIEFNDPRLNPNGGAISLGHPLGMSGARILYSAALELELRKQKYALVTMCIGVGQGYACVIENCNI
ncbi:MAG: acetyl-CoA C-acyltransferase [Saprospiraceae bacterium]|nr:acetyl-CoA C-acyltransferase [Saprospiraceae bacterium]MBK9720711.1 acetyl-CoA C-acyltransferase [Saprospiraceae bacterium]